MVWRESSLSASAPVLLNALLAYKSDMNRSQIEVVDSVIKELFNAALLAGKAKHLRYLRCTSDLGSLPCHIKTTDLTVSALKTFKYSRVSSLALRNHLERCNLEGFNMNSIYGPDRVRERTRFVRALNSFVKANHFTFEQAQEFLTQEAKLPINFPLGNVVFDEYYEEIQWSEWLFYQSVPPARAKPFERLHNQNEMIKPRLNKYDHAIMPLEWVLEALNLSWILCLESSNEQWSDEIPF